MLNLQVIQIWEDLHEERPGFFRAFWCDTPTSSIGCPVIGYCSPGGSHRTIQSVADEVLRLYPGEKIYRNGRELKTRRAVIFGKAS